MNHRFTSCLAVLAALAVPFAVQAQDGEGSAPDAEAAAMMEAYEQAGTPGEHHQALDRMAGEWEAEVRFWSDPDAEPMVTQATSTVEWVMDGRFLKETVESEFMGQPYHGIGRTGYDNTTGEFWSTWTDNMSTGLMTSRGKRQPDGHYEASWMDNHSTALYRYEGKMDDEGRQVLMSETIDPVSGEKTKQKSVSEFLSDDEMIARGYELRDGEEVRTMEIHYKRKM